MRHAANRRWQPRVKPLAGMRIVTPGHFAALGQPIIAGRPIERTDASHDVVIVNAALARRFFGSPPAAIGRAADSRRRHPGAVAVDHRRCGGRASRDADCRDRPEIYTVVGKTRFRK